MYPRNQFHVIEHMALYLCWRAFVTVAFRAALYGFFRDDPARPLFSALASALSEAGLGRKRFSARFSPERAFTAFERAKREFE